MLLWHRLDLTRCLAFRRIMPAIANGAVTFDTIAREWRCKYTGPAGESVSLEKAQKLLEKHLPALKALGGEVTRQVCGGCLDFKVSSPDRQPGPMSCTNLSCLFRVGTGLDRASHGEVWRMGEEGVRARAGLHSRAQED